MIKYPDSLKNLLLMLLAFCFLGACKDDDSPEPILNQTDADNIQVNNWVYSVMQDLYYWSDNLPANPNKSQDPTAFFKSLQFEGDRFSVIVPDYNKLINSLNGVNLEAGYEFMLSRESGSDNGVVAVILYVKNNSPAKNAGIKRGDVVTAINGTALNLSNYQDLIGQTSANHSITFRRFNFENSQYEQQPAINLGTVELAENPSHLDTVLNIGGKKIGYYVYNFFSNGAGERGYDKEMEEIFADFQQQGIDELVLDLRYNSGGTISSATTLGSLIGKGVDDQTIFYENKWNTQYQKYWEAKSDGDQILRGRFKSLASNIGNNLASGRLYVIVGSRTASASELLINGLKPYMDVYLIGEKTVGKNVGSIPIDDKENPKNTYGLLPIVMQIYNSEGFSDYSNGFQPDALVEEFKELPFRQLGDVQEPLLARAIQQITGLVAAKEDDHTNARKTYLKPISSSLDEKTRTNRLIYDLPVE